VRRRRGLRADSWFRFRDEETAQGLVEYALIIVVVSLGTIAALTFLRNRQARDVTPGRHLFLCP
jgi:hypothetical protein